MIEILHLFDQTRLIKLLDDLLSQAVDVHAPFGCVVDDGVDHSGGTGEVLTLHQRAFVEHFAAADGTVRRTRDGFFFAGSVLFEHFDDLGDHVAASNQRHHVADADVELGDVVVVVQRRTLHGDPLDLHGLEHRHGGDDSGAPHLGNHVDQPSLLLHGGKLVGHHPTGIFDGIAQRLLYRDAVDFDHHAVEHHLQLRTHLGQLPIDLLDLFDAVADPAYGRFAKAQIVDIGHHFAQVCIAQIVDPHAPGLEDQVARRGDRRIELAQASRRGVAGIGEGGFAFCHSLFVDPLELRQGHEHFAPNFDEPFVSDLQGNGSDRPGIVGHLFALHAVTPGNRLAEHSLLVDQVEARSVEFGLHVGTLAGKLLFDSGVPLFELRIVEDILHTPHPAQVLRLAKALFQRRAHPLRRRRGVNLLRMIPLPGFYLPVEPVVLFVGDEGIVLHIVGVSPFFECFDRLPVLFGRFNHIRSFCPNFDDYNVYSS